jgi:hypothetical protein
MKVYKMIENRKSFIPWVLVGGGVILVLAGLSWVLLNRQPARVATPTPASVAQVQRVSLAEAKAAYDAGTAVFVDVRDSSSFATSHIQGALLIPVNDISNRMSELNPSTWIITYCT